MNRRGELRLDGVEEEVGGREEPSARDLPQPAEGEPYLAMDDVRFRYPGAGSPAVNGVSVVCGPGRHVCVVGPNGAGKSTLLRLALGLLAPEAGRIRLWGLDPSAWPRRELARRIGVVAQERPPEFPITVGEFVEMGRHAHLRPWQALATADRAAVSRALELTDLGALVGRRMAALSGGELQRAKLARALAQQPVLLLLDEPTAHLDLGHEVHFFALLDRLIREQALAALTVTHSLHLAGRFADRVVLLAHGRTVASGGPRQVLRPETLQSAFGCAVEVVDLGELGLQIVPLAPGRGR